MSDETTGLDEPKAKKRQKHKKSLYRFEKLGERGLDLRVSQKESKLDVLFIGASWGMLDDLTMTQSQIGELSGLDAIRLVSDFFDKYVEGGKEQVPMDGGFALFDAIGEYLNRSMKTQKN